MPGTKKTIAELEALWVNLFQPEEQNYWDKFASFIHKDEYNAPNGVIQADGNALLPLAKLAKTLDAVTLSEGKGLVGDAGGNWTIADLSAGINLVLQGAAAVKALTLKDSEDIFFDLESGETSIFFPRSGIKSLINSVDQNITVTASQMLSYVKVGTVTGNKTCTLPAISAVTGKGKWIWIVNTGHTGAFAVTLAANGSDKISKDADGITTDSNSFVMPSGRCYLLRKPDSGTVWEVVLKTWFTQDQASETEQTEITAANNGGTVVLDASLSHQFVLNTGTDYAYSIQNLKKDRTITVRQLGAGNPTGISATDFTIANKLFSKTGITLWSEIGSTSNDLFCITRQGDSIFMDSIPQSSLP